jgi:hypothetical protein
MRNADAGLRQLSELTTGRNADVGLTFLRHLHMIFQYHLARITPSAAVYGRAGLSPTAFLNAGLSNCPASNQSGTVMSKNSDAGSNS